MIIILFLLNLLLLIVIICNDGNDDNNNNYNNVCCLLFLSLYYICCRAFLQCQASKKKVGHILDRIGFSAAQANIMNVIGKQRKIIDLASFLFSSIATLGTIKNPVLFFKEKVS